jgi:hypothetical protein
MSIGKYLTNIGVIGALVGALGTMRQTQAMPKDWRRYIVWVVWAAGLALAIAGVAKQAEDEQYEAELKEFDREQKAASKAARRAK